MTTSQPTRPAASASSLPPDGFRRRFLAALYRHVPAQLVLLLAAPVGWFGAVYLGSLVVLLLSSFWYLNPITSAVVREFSLSNFQQLISDPVNRVIVWRTVSIAGLVTIADVAVAFPIAYFMARVAAPRTRSLLFVAVLLPLWSNYLVRVFAWRIILAQGGPLDGLLGVVGAQGPGYSDVSTWLVFTYLWLPYMILPIYAGFERIPGSLLEASADLGAQGRTTFRRVVWPLVLPAVAAGSIFTFSLTLGDYITPALVSKNQFLGTVIYDNQGVANNVPFAATLAIVPIVIMAIYLLLARRLGAFDAL
jgi:putative spermidine/putrescine transport system permease protein